MINQNLHRQPVALDSNLHRNLKLRLPITDWTLATGLNAIFVAAAEFGDTCREFPIVFVKAGKEPDGSEAIAPIAVFGLTQNENLYVSGTRWRANYMPAVLRSYPFCIARLDDERFAVCFDSAWPGTSVLEGAPLFAEDGKPAELLTEITKHMENMEGEIQRTRLVCSKLQELDLLRDMRFEAQIPGGQTFTVDGFFTVDEARLNALPDATLVDLQPSGRFLIAAGQLSNAVGVHAIDAASGALTLRHELAVGRNPNWVEAIALA